MRTAVDTNVIAYSIGVGQSPSDQAKLVIADAVLAELIDSGPLVVPVQVCMELHHLLVRKLKFDTGQAGKVVREYTQGAILIPTDSAVMEAAFDLSGRHRLQTYDAVILAAAARAGCDVLYSEDMQDGFEWEGVRVVNPFA